VTRRPALGCLFEVVETLVLTLFIFFVIQTFVAQPYQVQQQSMEHTLEPSQYVLVDKLTPRFDAYNRGDIVVFDPPANWSDTGTPFIKRIIGLGGDKVEIRDDGFVYVNGEKLAEPYINPDASELTTSPGDEHAWTVPDGDLFVLGDNRAHSLDSRVFGPISLSHVIGRAWLRYWPINTFGIINTPVYGNLDPSSRSSGSPSARPSTRPSATPKASR
jgi:signal peptidase I